MKSSSEIIALSREELRGRWGGYLGASAIYILLTMAVNALPGAGSLISLLVTGPFAVGWILFIYDMKKGTTPSADKIFAGFSDFSRIVITQLLMVLFTVLWTLLFIVPGVIAALSYSMTFYLMVDDPNLREKEALTRSKELMRGNKGRLFGLLLRFIPWAILGVLSLGIGFLWIIPWMQMSVANFYQEIKKEKGMMGSLG